MAIFADRADAGRELAGALDGWRGSDAVVIGIPRGGVVVAAEVSRVLGLPLAVVIVRKLGAPSHEEFAVGAIAEDVRLVNDDALAAGYATPDQLASVEEQERSELKRRTALFAASIEDVSGRPALVVDDGVATGASATVACRSLRARGVGRVVLAVPVAPAEWRPPPDAVDEYVCLRPQQEFWAVGQFYDDFAQTTDAEVIALLRDASTGSATSSGP